MSVLGCEVVHDAASAGGFAKHGDAVGIAAEEVDVFLDPDVR